jgi:hypothetical protein
MLTYLRFFAGAADKHPEVFGYMGTDYEKLHKTDVSIEAYTVRVQMGQNNRMSTHAKQRLAELKKNLSAARLLQHAQTIGSYEQEVPRPAVARSW